MKTTIIKISIFFILFISIGHSLLWGQEPGNSFVVSATKQESRSSLIFSGSFMHFQGKQNNDAGDILGYYTFPVNAGLGILYQYQIEKKSYLLSGINYQACHIASTEHGILRFRYREPSISVYFKHYFFRNKKNGLHSSIGLSYGRMKLMASESHGHIADWNDFGTTYLENYSNNNAFIDAVFTTGFFLSSSNIEIAPSIGYRVKDNWMGYYRHRFFYGLQINYELKFWKK